MPLKSAPTQPRAVPTSRPVWSGAHIKGADSFHRTPTKLASAHDDRPNSPRARARHAAANTRKAPVDLEKRARRRQSADLAGRERSARRGGRHAFEVKSVRRRAAFAVFRLHRFVCSVRVCALRSTTLSHMFSLPLSLFISSSLTLLRPLSPFGVRAYIVHYHLPQTARHHAERGPRARLPPLRHR